MSISNKVHPILHQLRCITCNSIELELTAHKISCAQCLSDYDIVNDIPCLVRYQPQEVLSLIEILANLDTDRTPPTREAYNLWIKILDEYHTSIEKGNYLDKLTGGIRKFLPHRYRQYSLMMNVTEGIPLTGKKILDVGAGEGFDTALLISLGCEVTAVEFNPISASLGKLALPEARWFCGSAHALPFADESFDYVFCQAALHHFTDVSAAIREMLRVLKVDGALFTISDSYRSIHEPEDSILKQFNNDPAVLRGVNENVPSIVDFFKPLEEYAQALDVTIYTSMIYNFIDTNKKRAPLEGIRRWNYPDDYPALAVTNGGLSLKITKKTCIDIAAPLLSTEVCRPTILADRRAIKVKALADLAEKLPAVYANTAFPGAQGNTKFQLLNGWRYREKDETGRSAYSRCRWFLSRSEVQHFLQITIAATDENASRGDKLDIYVGGKLLQQHILNSPCFMTTTISISHIPKATTFCVELKYAAPDHRFEDALFQVKAIALSETDTDAKSQNL